MVTALLCALVLFGVMLALAGVGPFNPGGRGSLPGQTPRLFQTQNNFVKSPDHYMTRGALVEASAIDAGNTPTTKLRAGLVLVRVETGANAGQWVQLGHADDPGVGNRLWAIILFEAVNMLSRDMVTTEQKDVLGIVHGRVDNSKIIYGSVNPADIDDVQGILDQVYFE
ncbi:MAG TPA: hypothetical protein VG457_08275 [Planctomycetota bacterium]|jgi:hypothetical protein|nr:hypothetical protein [Planctomycetota bacterium]